MSQIQEDTKSREYRKKNNIEAKKSGETFKKCILNDIMSLEREGYGE